MTRTKAANIASIIAALLPFIAALLAMIIIFFAKPSVSRDIGQWEATDLQIRAWYRELKQPDYPSVPCCGEADAYWADSFEVDGDSYIAIITDTREDGPLGRPHIPDGTRVHVPNVKLKWDRGNPTGHGVIFVNTTLQVLCYVVPGGV